MTQDVFDGAFCAASAWCFVRSGSFELRRYDAAIQREVASEAGTGTGRT
jgi:hypothetical protein